MLPNLKEELEVDENSLDEEMFFEDSPDPEDQEYKPELEGEEVDAIAAAWARSRKVAQVTFQPNWRAFGKAAGFKAIDQMLDTPNPLGGVAIFGKTGIALNLAQKAEDEGIKVMRIERPKDQ